jgi:membrane-bound metal-dependent hydrolase YbcI (DUF457 family)
MALPPLHFAVPFVALKAAGVDTRRCLLVSLIALTPDLDVLFNDHRSPTHSLVMLGLVVLLSFAFTWKRKSARYLVLLAGFGLFSHILLDLFQYPTPFLWPLGQSFVLPDPHFDRTTIVASFVLLAPITVQGIVERVKLARNCRTSPFRAQDEDRSHATKE